PQQLAGLPTVALPLEPVGNLFQFRPKLLLRCPAFHLEAPIARLAAVMRETEKVERFRFLALALGLLAGKPSEGDQFRLGGFDLQVEFPQPCFQFTKKMLGILAVLKTSQEVIRITEKIGLSPALTSKAALKPALSRIRVSSLVIPSPPL